MFQVKNGFERRRELKKSSILKAAAQMFLENGFEKVTIHQIATRAHVSYAVIFKYFVSKDNLIREVMKWLYELKYNLLESIARSKDSFPERCEQMFLQNTKVLDIDLDIINKANYPDSDAISDVRMQYDTKSRLLYLAFFAEGKRDGYIQPEVSVDAILLHREAFRALIQLRPELFLEFKYNRRLFRDYMRALQFGIMNDTEEPDES